MSDDFGEMLDTSPANRRRYYALLRELTPQQRARKAVDLGRAARAMALAGIQRAYPNAGAEEISARLAARLYGAAVAARLFPHVPLGDP